MGWRLFRALRKPRTISVAILAGNERAERLRALGSWRRQQPKHSLSALRMISAASGCRTRIVLVLGLVSALLWLISLSERHARSSLVPRLQHPERIVCHRQTEDYVALMGCCSRAGLGHALAAQNRVVHLAHRLHLRLVCDPLALRGLGHGIGDAAEAFFDFCQQELCLHQVPPDHISIRFTATSLEACDERELLALIQQWRCSLEQQPSLRARPLFFQFHEVFNPGGALAPSWTYTAQWWRTLYQRRLASRAGIREFAAAAAVTTNQTLILAIHVRRGDQVPRGPNHKPNAYIEAGLRRNLPDAWYVAAAAAAFRAHCQRHGDARCAQRPIHIQVFSESPSVDMDGYPSRLHQWLQDQFPNATVTQHLDASVFDALTAMTAAEVFVGSRSAFSVLVARLSAANSTVLLPPQLPSRYIDPNEAPLPCSLEQVPWQLRVVGEPPGALYWPVYTLLPLTNATATNNAPATGQTWRKINQPLWRMSRHSIHRNFFTKHWPSPRNWSYVAGLLRDPSNNVSVQTSFSEVRVLPYCT